MDSPVSDTLTLSSIGTALGRAGVVVTGSSTHVIAHRWWPILIVKKDIFSVQHFSGWWNRCSPADAHTFTCSLFFSHSLLFHSFFHFLSFSIQLLYRRVKRCFKSSWIWSKVSMKTPPWILAKIAISISVRAGYHTVFIEAVVAVVFRWPKFAPQCGQNVEKAILTSGATLSLSFSMSWGNPDHSQCSGRLAELHDWPCTWLRQECSAVFRHLAWCSKEFSRAPVFHTCTKRSQMERLAFLSYPEYSIWWCISHSL